MSIILFQCIFYMRTALCLIKLRIIKFMGARFNVILSFENNHVGQQGLGVYVVWKCMLFWYNTGSCFQMHPLQIMPCHHIMIKTKILVFSRLSTLQMKIFLVQSRFTAPILIKISMAWLLLPFNGPTIMHSILSLCPNTSIATMIL